MCFVFLIRVDCLCALKLMKIYPQIYEKFIKNPIVCTKNGCLD